MVCSRVELAKSSIKGTWLSTTPKSQDERASIKRKEQHFGAAVKQRYPCTNRILAVVGGFGLLAVCALAQAPQASGPNNLHTSESRTVPLMSDACPAVHPGGKVSLELNPGFEYPGVVVGLGNFYLFFGRLVDDSVIVRQVRPLRMGGVATNIQVTSIGNGYFHIELPIPAHVAPGEYHLINATTVAKVLPEYQGPTLTMTVSPVRERYCITVVSPTASQTPLPGS